MHLYLPITGIQREASLALTRVRNGVPGRWPFDLTCLGGFTDRQNPRARPPQAAGAHEAEGSWVFPPC